MYSDRVDYIIRNLDNVIQIAKQDSIKEIYGMSKSRIFEKGLSKYDQPIGKYNTDFHRLGSDKSYVQERKDKGLQTAFVDLVFTGKLKDSIESNNISQIYFKNIYGSVIMAENEKNFKTRIAAPDQKEKEVYLKILTEELTKLWKS